MNRRAIYLAGVAALLAPLSNSIYAPSMAIVRDDLGTTNALAAATISIYGLGLALAQLFYGPLVDRYPPRRIILVTLVVYALATLGSYLAPTVVLLIAGRGIQAFAVAGALVAGPALVSELAPPERRGSALGTYQFFVLIGPVLGPLIGSVVATAFSWRADFLVLALGAAIVLGLVWAWLPERRVHAERASGLALTLIAGNSAALATGLAGFSQFFCLNAVLVFLPVLLRARFDLPEIWIGPCLVITTGCMAIGSPIGGRLSDRFGRRLPIVGGLVGATVAYGVLAVVALVGTSPEWLGLVLVALAGLGVAFSLGWGSQLALLVDWFPERRGTAVASYNFCRFLGTAVGPLVTGTLVDRLGIGDAFVGPWLVLGLATVVGVLFVRQPNSSVRPGIAASSLPGQLGST